MEKRQLKDNPDDNADVYLGYCTIWSGRKWISGTGHHSKEEAAELLASPNSNCVEMTEEHAHLSIKRGGWIELEMDSDHVKWPERYYAVYDCSEPQPAPVKQWLDAWMSPDALDVPERKNLVPLTVTQWDDASFRGTGKGVLDGKIIAYTTPSPEQENTDEATTQTNS